MIGSILSIEDFRATVAGGTLRLASIVTTLYGVRTNQEKQVKQKYNKIKKTKTLLT